MDGTFYECASLCDIPSDLFTGCTKVTSFSSTFWGCTGITTIPENLFMNCKEVTNFRGTFSGSGVTTIPEALFVNNTKVTIFDSMFSECKKITNVPEKLFASCPHVEHFDGVFSECELRMVPANLFDNNRRVISFGRAFYGCSTLTGESPYSIINGEKVHLYERYKYPTEFVTPYTEHNSPIPCFYGCDNLSDYNNIPDDWK